MLTVRELARSFPDDFVFFGLVQRQYEEVVASFPPPIAKIIGEMIKAMIKEFCSLPKGGDGSIEGAPPARKRRRED